MRNKRNATIALVLGVLACLVGGWLLLRDATSLQTFPLNTLQPEGEKASLIYDLVLIVFIPAGVIFIIVEVGVLWLANRFKRRDEVDGEDEPVQIHGNTGLEIGWTIVPLLILAVLAVFNANAILKMQDVSDDAITTIDVIGQQWWWEYRYDVDDNGSADIITATQLVIPAGRDVELSIQSRDVIHSFWIPALNGKMDAVPGRTHPLVLQAYEPGIYEGQCTEYCGLSHGVMRMQVKALPQDEYDAWIERMTTAPEQPDPEDTDAVAGQELFVQQCAACHQVNGLDPSSEAPFTYAAEPNPNYGADQDSPLLSKNAPNLTHLMMRQTFAGNLLDLYLDGPATNLESGQVPVEVVPSGVPDTNNLKRWLRNPEDVKPMRPENGQGMPNLGLSEAQIDQLVAYLVTLK